LKKQTIQNGVQDIEAGEITGLQTLFATALKTEQSVEVPSVKGSFEKSAFAVAGWRTCLLAVGDSCGQA